MGGEEGKEEKFFCEANSDVDGGTSSCSLFTCRQDLSVTYWFIQPQQKLFKKQNIVFCYKLLFMYILFNFISTAICLYHVNSLISIIRDAWSIACVDIKRPKGRVIYLFRETGASPISLVIIQMLKKVLVRKIIHKNLYKKKKQRKIFGFCALA